MAKRLADAEGADVALHDQSRSQVIGTEVDEASHDPLPPDDPGDLQARIEAMLAMSQAQREAQSADLASYVGERFSIQTMVNSVMAGYGEALALHRPSIDAPRTTVPSPN